jgi:hypothetical protein
MIAKHLQIVLGVMMLRSVFLMDLLGPTLGLVVLRAVIARQEIAIP